MRESPGGGRSRRTRIMVLRAQFFAKIARFKLEVINFSFCAFNFSFLSSNFYLDAFNFNLNHNKFELLPFKKKFATFNVGLGFMDEYQQ